MKLFRVVSSAAVLTLCFQSSCDKTGSKAPEDTGKAAATAAPDMQRRTSEYTSVQLAADTSNLTAKERQMLPLLIDAARAMDPIYWAQTYGSRDSLMKQVSD